MLSSQYILANPYIEFQKKYKIKYVIHQHTITTELQASDSGQAHSECGGVKNVIGWLLAFYSRDRVIKLFEMWILLDEYPTISFIFVLIYDHKYGKI